MQFIGCDVAKLTLDLAWRDPVTGRWSMAEKIPNDKAGWQAVIRWAQELLAVDLAEFGVVMHGRTVGKQLRELGYRRLSVRPRHPKADEAAQEAFKKASRRR